MDPLSDDGYSKKRLQGGECKKRASLIFSFSSFSSNNRMLYKHHVPPIPSREIRPRLKTFVNMPFLSNISLIFSLSTTFVFFTLEHTTRIIRWPICWPERGRRCTTPILAHNRISCTFIGLCGKWIRKW